jgi:hypothetical protein
LLAKLRVPNPWPRTGKQVRPLRPLNTLEEKVSEALRLATVENDAREVLTVRAHEAPLRPAHKENAHINNISTNEQRDSTTLKLA